MKAQMPRISTGVIVGFGAAIAVLFAAAWVWAELMHPPSWDIGVLFDGMFIEAGLLIAGVGLLKWWLWDRRH
jgi:hypothetical protein